MLLGGRPELEVRGDRPELDVRPDPERVELHVAAEVLRARPLRDALREHGGPRRQHGGPARLGAQERAAPRRGKAIFFCQMWEIISNFSMFFKPANFRQNSNYENIGDKRKNDL